MSDNDQVKLKPLFGIEPGKYLVVIYSIILAAIIFLILFLPGIINPGSVFVFNTEPENAIILVDGEYKGATPCEVFIPRGSHSIAIKKHYFETAEFRIESQGRLFASLIFPKKVDAEYSLPLLDAEGLMADSFQDFAEWGMLDGFFDNYQPKEILKPLFKDLIGSGYADIASMSGFLYSAIPFVHNEELYKDFYAAVIQFEELRSGETMEADEEFIEGFTKIKFFQDSSDFMENLPFWFYSLLSEANRESKISWYPALQEEYGGFLRDFSNDFPAPKAALTIEGMRFIMLSGGQFLAGADGNSFPYPAAVDDLIVMESEVTNELYRLFLAENPDWRKHNTETLIDKGLVNRDYLKDFETSGASEPVNFISWYAANAFCSWLQQKLPAYLSDYRVKLPDEHQWEWTALTDTDNTGVFSDNTEEGPLSIAGRYPNNSGFYDLKGNLWEWCDNWYAPAAPLITSRNPVYNEAYYGIYPGVEKSVRGGSWANEDDLSLSARGSQPPQWCTEFLGFRPVLVKE